jgi:hypothetical protein
MIESFEVRLCFLWQVLEVDIDNGEIAFYQRVHDHMTHVVRVSLLGSRPLSGRQWSY